MWGISLAYASFLFSFFSLGSGDYMACVMTLLWSFNLTLCNVYFLFHSLMKTFLYSSLHFYFDNLFWVHWIDISLSWAANFLCFLFLRFFNLSTFGILCKMNTREFFISLSSFFKLLSKNFFHKHNAMYFHIEIDTSLSFIKGLYDVLIFNCQSFWQYS